MKGLVAEAIIVVITLVSTIAIVSNVAPIIDNSRQAQAFSDAKQTLKTVDSVINQLMYEAPGSKRSLDLKLGTGSRFIFSGTEDKIKIRLSPSGLLESGTRIEEDGFVIQGGGTLNAYDNGTHFILENSAVLVAFRKIGAPTNHTFINTTEIISLIRNKRLNVDVEPRTGIFIDDEEASASGQGYTELSRSLNLQTAAVRVFVNSTYADYDAIFTLQAATDYFELEINNPVLKG